MRGVQLLQPKWDTFLLGYPRLGCAQCGGSISIDITEAGKQASVCACTKQAPQNARLMGYSHRRGKRVCACARGRGDALANRDGVCAAHPNIWPTQQLTRSIPENACACAGMIGAPSMPMQTADSRGADGSHTACPSGSRPTLIQRQRRDLRLPPRRSSSARA